MSHDSSGLALCPSCFFIPNPYSDAIGGLVKFLGFLSDRVTLFACSPIDPGASGKSPSGTITGHLANGNAPLFEPLVGKLCIDATILEQRKAQRVGDKSVEVPCLHANSRQSGRFRTVYKNCYGMMSFEACFYT